MKHTIFFIGLIVFMHMFIGVEAEAERTPLPDLIAQVTQASELPTAALEEIAFAVYEVLMSTPFRGVRDSLSELEQVLRLKQALEQSSGLRERLLAVTITEGVNRLLLFEAARKSSAESGKIVPPPFQTGSFQADTVKTLLQQNRIDEREAIASIRELKSQFATFCRSKNFRVEDFLTGEAVRSFSREWREMLGQRTAIWQSSVELSTLEDLLFGLVLTVIDQGKDTEILCDIYITTSPGSSKKLKALIQQRLDEQPIIRLSLGGYTSKNHVYTTLRNYRGRSLGDWPRTLTKYFVPFFQQSEERLEFIRKIFAEYELTEKEIKNLPPFGGWLEPVE